MKADDIRALLVRWAQAYARRDAAGLTACYADDCVIVSPLYGTLTGRAAVENSFRNFFGAFPDSILHFEDQLVFGNQAVQVLAMHGTDTGGLLGEAPTGKPFSVLVALFMTFGQGLIVHQRRIYDRGSLLLQLAGETDRQEETSRLYRSALDKALTAHEVSVAAQIQHALLPPRLHSGAGFEIAAASIPCRAIGGDFVDYFDLPGGAFAFALGDIAGKGPPAALLAGLLQGIFASRAPTGETPANMLAHVNDVMMRRKVDSRFATVVYGQLDGDRLTYCNAGHNAPFMIGLQARRRLDKGGVILGAFGEATFEEETVRLDPGDVMVAFTDGVTEAVNADGEEFGEDRLLDCLEAHRNLSAADQLDCLFETLRSFTEHTPQRDDVTAMVLRYTGTAR